MRSRYLWAAAILLLLLVGFFARTLFTDRLNSPADILQIESTTRLAEPAASGGTAPPETSDSPAVQPQNPLSGDAILQFEPWYQFDRRSLKEGEFPWWNPYQGNGVPHVANSQSALFYPLTWLVIVLGYKWGLLLAMAAKLFLIGFFTYCYLREIRVRHLPALFGAAAFMFAGSNMVWLYWPIPTVMFFLPLGLWLVERATNHPSQLRNYVGFALALAAGFLAGHVQTFTHCALIIVAYALAILLFKTYGPTGGLKHWRRKLGVALGLLLAGLVGLALTGVQLLPFIEYLQHSFELVARSSLAQNPYWLLVRYIGLNVVPDLLGNQAWHGLAQVPGFVASATNYNDVTSGYVGLLVVGSALAGIVACARSKRVWFFVALLAGTLGLVYHAPHWFTLLTRVPLLDSTNHIRLLFAAAFALCVLAALFWSNLIERRASRTARWIGVTGALTLLGAATVLTFLVGMEQVLPSGELTTTYLRYLHWVLPFIALDAGLLALVFALTRWRWVAFGVAALVMLAETGLHGLWYQPATTPAQHYPVTPLLRYLQQQARVDRFMSISSTAHVWPNLGMYYGFLDPRVYDSLGVADQQRAFSTYVASLGNSQGITAAQAQYLSAIGVRYILARDEYELVTIMGLRPEELPSYRPVLQTPDFILYENLRVWPRAFLASDLSFFAYPERVDRTVPITLESYKNNSLSLLLTAPADQYVVVSDTYYPGWVAYVDEVPTEIEQADLNFRAVFVHAGPHRIELRYEPRSIRYGKGLSVLGLILLITVPLCIFLIKKKRHAP
ncbi:MAG: YfhO family protein [Candidatus Andersenbacteria bacterium]